MNPYDFVRFGRPAPRRGTIQHDRFEGHSGVLMCRLEARTEIFIPQTQEGVTRAEREFRKYEHQQLKLMRSSKGVPLLPGSSLKGVVRSVAEALSGSCITLPQDRSNAGEIEYRDSKKGSNTYQIPQGFHHCLDAAQLCPACRLFGSQPFGSSRRNRRPFLGKVGIGDALAVGEVTTRMITLEILMQPKPRHRVWYGHPDDSNVMAGRKFYRHRRTGARTAEESSYNKTVEAVQAGALFRFVVDYTNLTDDELALLVFSLVLEPDLCHKVGMGKPVGLGSARIEIERWQQINRRARYQGLGNGITTLEDEAAAAEVERWRRQYYTIYADWHESLEDLRRIWRWDQAPATDVKYPTQDWFRQNPRVPLSEAP